MSFDFEGFTCREKHYAFNGILFTSCFISYSICGGGYPCFELSAVNADKPPLAISQIKDRVKQFEKVGMSLHMCYDVLSTS